MNKQDWNDYASYLKAQVNTATLAKPETIAESYTNFQVMQDLDNVLYVKLRIKRPNNAKAKV